MDNIDDGRSAWSRDAAATLTLRDGANEWTITPPARSDWECELYGMGRAVVWNPAKDQKIPNWFWRKMQFLILGHRWVRRKK